MNFETDQLPVIRIQKIELKRIAFLFLSILLSSIIHSQPVKSLPKKLINILFQNMVDSQVMELRNTYQNAFGEEYAIRNFKYYISNISLHSTDNKQFFFPGTYLVNEADSGSKTINISAGETGFKSISFLVGVDSIYNVSGTQTGDLDPVKGMFWTWNSGYIMAKLEASSPLSQEPNNNVTFHIGGFKTGQNTARLVTLDIPQPKDKAIVSDIVIEANASKWFNAVHNIKIAENPVCTTPGKLAVQFADNYAQMFSIASVN